MTPAECRPSLCIDRCVCHGVTFAEVVHWSKSCANPTADGAARALGCTTSCGMCLPYVERALETGQAVFHEILPVRRGLAR